MEDKVSSYEQAIKIYPNRIEAYTCMLEAYEDEGKFGKKENDEFLALYNAHKDNFDVTSKEYAELNKKAAATGYVDLVDILFLLQTLKTKRYHQSLNIKNYQIVTIEFVRFIRPTY